MQELIEKLQAEHGLSADQSQGILGTVTNFIKEKFPMAEGMIDNLFHHNAPTATNQTNPAPQESNDSADPADTAPANTTAADTTPNSDPSINKGGSFLDKISDMLPGQTGEKVEEFAKEKLGGLFGGNK